jgi:hypothetical protein
LEPIVPLIGSLILESQASIYQRLSVNPEIDKTSLELLRGPIKYNLVSYDTYIHEGDSIAEIQFRDANFIQFYFDGLSSELWSLEPNLRSLIEHELLHIPTRHNLPTGPVLSRISIYVPKNKTYQDITAPIWDMMLDVQADKYMLPESLENYYDTILIQQFLIYEYLTNKMRKEFPSIQPIKEKAAAFLRGEVVRLDFVYPWINLIRHLYMWVVSKYHGMSFLILDKIFTTWSGYLKKLVLALIHLYQEILTQKAWKDQYIERTARIRDIIREFTYAEVDMTIVLQKRER